MPYPDPPPQGPVSASFSQPPHVLSVRAFTESARIAIEASFSEVWVEGEVSNFKRHTSGHCYFTLKDEEAQIRCVMWRHMTRFMGFSPVDGMLVRLYGKASVYERRGDLQLVASALELAGEGALQKAFEALKQKLEAEGLFDAAAKKPLPPFPETIGIVTSGTGAALQDILSILERRFPQVRVLVCPVQVQGLGASDMIAEAIDAFDAVPPGEALRADVLIIGRGGGSAEDLWAFNDEAVARAIHRAGIPIISAVGHETDVTISDFVADLRAATPSMAAELAVPDRRDIAAHVQGLYAVLYQAMTERIATNRRHIERLTLSHAFNRPVDRLRQVRIRADELNQRLARTLPRYLENRHRAVQSLQGRLTLLDPRRPLSRGYALVEQGGRAVRRVSDLDRTALFTLRFEDGTVRVRADPEEASQPSKGKTPPPK